MDPKVPYGISTAYQYYSLPHVQSSMTPVSNPYQHPHTTPITNPSPQHYPQPHPMLPGMALNNNNHHHYALPPQQQQQINNGGNNSPYPLQGTKRISYMSRYDARQKQSFSANPEIVIKPIQSIQPHQQQNSIYAGTTPYYPHTPLQTIHSNPHPTVINNNNTISEQKEASEPQQQPPPKRKSNLSQALPPPAYHKSSPRETRSTSRERSPRENTDNVNASTAAKERAAHHHKISNQEPISAFQLESIQKKERAKLQFTHSNSNHVGSVSSASHSSGPAPQRTPLQDIYSNGKFAHAPSKTATSKGPLTAHPSANSVASSRNTSFRVTGTSNITNIAPNDNDEKNGGQNEDDEDMDLEPSPTHINNIGNTRLRLNNISHQTQETEMTEMTEFADDNNIDMQEIDDNNHQSNHSHNISMNSIPNQHVQSLSSELKTFKIGQQANNTINVNSMHRIKSMPKSSLALMNSGLVNAQGGLSMFNAYCARIEIFNFYTWDIVILPFYKPRFCEFEH